MRRPDWIKLNPLGYVALDKMDRLMQGLKLRTVCHTARCPNRSECFARGTAAFMILGNVCTRNCSFCAVLHGRPLPPDPQEPQHIVEAISKLRLKHAVITSVSRDDLTDGGAKHFARTIRAIREFNPTITVEVLIPDFRGSLSALQKVIDAHPAILNHNVETVPRLYSDVRPEADFRRSLNLLHQAKQLDGRLLTKSGLMLGLGELRREVIAAMADLRQVGCDMLTIGQYLPPSLKHHELVRYVPPEEFEQYMEIGKKMRFSSIFAGPLVRSSFNAAETYQLALPKSRT